MGYYAGSSPNDPLRNMAIIRPVAGKLVEISGNPFELKPSPFFQYFIYAGWNCTGPRLLISGNELSLALPGFVDGQTIYFFDKSSPLIAGHGTFSTSPAGDPFICTNSRPDVTEWFAHEAFTDSLPRFVPPYLLVQ